MKKKGICITTILVLMICSYTVWAGSIGSTPSISLSETVSNGATVYINDDVECWTLNEDVSSKALWGELRQEQFLGSSIISQRSVARGADTYWYPNIAAYDYFFSLNPDGSGAGCQGCGWVWDYDAP